MFAPGRDQQLQPGRQRRKKGSASSSSSARRIAARLLLAIAVLRPVEDLGRQLDAAVFVEEANDRAEAA
jgi:hypothetical protein